MSNPLPPGLSLRREATGRAARVLWLAHDEALRVGDTTLTPVHLLLGIIVEGECAAALILLREVARRSVDAETPAETRALLVSQLREVLGPAASSGPCDPPPSAALSFVLARALAEAERLGHPFVSAEHLLIGLADAGMVGMYLGLEDAEVRRETLAELRLAEVWGGGKVVHAERPEARHFGALYVASLCTCGAVFGAAQVDTHGRWVGCDEERLAAAHAAHVEGVVDAQVVDAPLASTQVLLSAVDEITAIEEACRRAASRLRDVVRRADVRHSPG